MKPVQNMLSRAGGVGITKHPRRAFTLLEVLIAVAALGLLAVGLAQIFDATGKTVAAGRRVSSVNAYASLIELQLRSDISKMTRDGFLVIRNENADRSGNGIIELPPAGQTTGGDAVPLYNGDERARMRRIDELMFFAKGEFASARNALHPAYIAKSDAARIYYGHGRRAFPAAFNATDPYYQPEITGTSVDEDTRLGLRLDDNPNEFASEWILQRLVTLLAPPRTNQAAPPNPLPFLGLTVQQLEDSPIQISLQPAASHIFRGLADKFPLAVVAPVSIRSIAHPNFKSGLVDIAATDLSLIRTVVTTASKFPFPPIDDDFFRPNQNGDPDELNNDGADGMFTLYASDNTVINRMRSWMLDALPANSHDLTVRDRERVRCELSPRNYLGTIDPGQYVPTSAEAAYRLADQVMLSASNFLPRCTEFIVEWSFGETWPTDPNATNPNYNATNAGQHVWHGMNRNVGGTAVAQIYDNTNNLHRASLPYLRVDGATRQHTVLTELILPFAANALPLPGVSIDSCFGYFDPTFNPDLNNDGKLESPQDSISPTIPWAWPKLIRVTLSLADPSDPTIERTFQFVFQVPDGV